MKLNRNKFVRKNIYSFSVNDGTGFYGASFNIERDRCRAESHYGNFEQLFDRCRKMKFEDAFWFARAMAKVSGWKFKYQRLIENQ